VQVISLIHGRVSRTVSPAARSVLKEGVVLWSILQNRWKPPDTIGVKACQTTLGHRRMVVLKHLGAAVEVFLKREMHQANS